MCVFVLVACVSSVSSAQTSQAAIAETLFNEGRALLEKKDFDAACPKFLESQRIDPNTATALNLAHCYEKAGKTASAWGAFREAAALARRNNFPERAKTAVSRAQQLEPLLAKVTIMAAGEAPAPTVKIDRTVLGARTRRPS